MTQAAAFLLYAIEQALVTNGACSLPESPETAELSAAGALGGKDGAWTLTAYGWQVAHAFRRWRFDNVGPLSVGVTPDFQPPLPTSDQASVCATARDTFTRMMATAPDTDPAPIATKAIAAAAAFEAARKGAGLPDTAAAPDEV